MPSVILYCQHDDCGKGYASVDAKVPPVCPACSRPSKWHTNPRTTVPFTLTKDDRAFLKAIRIDPT